MLILALAYMLFSLNTEANHKVVIEHTGANALPWPKEYQKKDVA